MRKILVTVILTLSVAGAFFLGCAQRAAREGDTVRVAYVGRLDNDSVFDSTVTGDYVTFVLGQHHVIRGLEAAVLGMKPGEQKDVVIPPDSAYGPFHPELTHELPIDSFPDSITPAVGMKLNMAQPNGRQVPIRITDIKDDSVLVLDANHPLAGKTLHFHLTLIGLTPKKD